MESEQIKDNNIEKYVETLFNIFRNINDKAEDTKDNRRKMIGLVIYNYVKYMAKIYDIELNKIKISETVNLLPIFEYIETNKIELYDFTKIELNDVDVLNKEDLERFVLTHVYYLTQKQKI